MGYGYYSWWDPTYILVIIGALLCMLASARVKGTFHKYSQIRSMGNLTGAQAAERVLRSAYMGQRQWLRSAWRRMSAAMRFSIRKITRRLRYAARLSRWRILARRWRGL